MKRISPGEGVRDRAVQGEGKDERRLGGRHGGRALWRTGGEGLVLGFETGELETPVA